MSTYPHAAARPVLALIAGAATPFAFAPYDYYVLAVLCLGALFWLWDGAGRRAAAVIGLCFGLGMFGHGVWWIQVSVHQFGLPLYSFSVAVTAAFVLFMSGYPALAGYVAAAAPAPVREMRVLFVFPAAWTAVEVLRGWLFSGFPWLLIGYSQVDSPLSVFAPLLGVYGVSLVAAFAAAGALLLWRGGRVWRGLAVMLLGALLVCGVILGDVRWTEAAGGPKQVALIQGAVPQALKWNHAYRQQSIDLYAALSEPHWGRSLLVWPETAIPAFAEEVPETVAALDRRARESGTSLLVGMPRRAATDEGEYFNSVIQFGAITGGYDKRQLVPFGEYLPFDSWIRPLTTFLRIPMSDFSTGVPEQPLLSADGYEIGVSICYEDAYAGEVARALPQANVLVNVSNDAWFGDSIAPHQHLQIARMRAIETGRYMLRATNTGISAIIDERGDIRALSRQFVPAVVAGEMTPRTGSTPATQYGIRFTLSLCVMAFLLATLPGRRRAASA